MNLSHYVSVTVTCDKCGKSDEEQGDTKDDCLESLRCDGWIIDDNGDAICFECKGTEELLTEGDVEA